MTQKVDPITLQIFINILHTISDEMVASLVRTGYSTNIKDRRDCSCAIYNVKGEVIAQSELGTPLHLGTMSPTVQTVLGNISAEKMDLGDAIIVNKPYPAGPGHLNDVTMVSPVYYRDSIVGLVASMAHHVDMGGYAPGSMPFGVTEHYQEGLQIPPVKIMKKGQWNEELFSLIKDNLRTKIEFGGDLRAQLGANNVGIMRLHEVFEKYSLDKTLYYFEEVMNYSERRMRSAIREVPNGKCQFEDYIEGDSIEDRLIKIAASIDIQDEEIYVDFSGTDPEVKGPINCTIPNALAAVYYSIKSILDPDIPPNTGAYRPIHIHILKGSLLNANYPKPVCNSNIVTAQRIVDVIFGALKDVVPTKICAACSGTMNLINVGGKLPGKQQL
ncbi:MAG: hydantoinase B/oxoprolinase family protein, partial [Desulfatiglandales bacterium]|nr:hydantoinase B/oxoprolinase family protein [Desulfatiglandales bacterium]